MAMTVYIDGKCPMCVAGALRFQKLDAAQRAHFVNLHDPQWAALAEARFPPSDLVGAMRVQLEDGSWRVGWFAWAAILQAAPLTTWLGRFMLWPVFYGVGPALYRLVAARRIAISRLLRLPPPCDENGVCRIQ